MGKQVAIVFGTLLTLPLYWAVLVIGFVRNIVMSPSDWYDEVSYNVWLEENKDSINAAIKKAAMNQKNKNNK